MRSVEWGKVPQEKCETQADLDLVMPWQRTNHLPCLKADPIRGGSNIVYVSDLSRLLEIKI